MKKIINGKKYDTDTAKEVGSNSNGYYGNDFRSCTETLYQKKTGEFFLHGEGGPLTKYAASNGDSRGWGSAIVPLTDEEATAWAEKNLTADEFEALFGTVSEDSDFCDKLKAARQDANITRQQMFVETEIPPRTIENWESGTAIPPVYVQKFVIDFLRNRVKIYTADRETGTFIEEFRTIDDARNAILQYEEQDKADGNYTENFYDIVDQNHCTIHID